MDTVKRTPVGQFHPRAPGAGPEQVRRAIGSIPYHGPVLKPTLLDPPEQSQPAERARD